MRDLAGLVEDRERELSRLEGERLSDVMAHERLEAFDVLRLSPSRDIPFDLGDVDTTLRLLDAIRNAEPLKPPARTQPKVRLTRRPTCDFCLDGGEVRRMYVGGGFPRRIGRPSRDVLPGLRSLLRHLAGADRR